MEYGVNVIPEIDIPAHSLAFTHYKPEIGSDKYGMDHWILYKEETYRFVDSLLDEYLSGEKPVFIGPDVHIGTDEYNAKEAEKFPLFYRPVSEVCREIREECPYVGSTALVERKHSGESG